MSRRDPFARARRIDVRDRPDPERLAKDRRDVDPRQPATRAVRRRDLERAEQARTAETAGSTLEHTVTVPAGVAEHVRRQRAVRRLDETGSCTP